MSRRLRRVLISILRIKLSRYFVGYNMILFTFMASCVTWNMFCFCDFIFFSVCYPFIGFGNLIMWWWNVLYRWVGESMSTSTNCFNVDASNYILPFKKYKLPNVSLTINTYYQKKNWIKCWMLNVLSRLVASIF